MNSAGVAILRLWFSQQRIFVATLVGTNLNLSHFSTHKASRQTFQLSENFGIGKFRNVSRSWKYDFCTGVSRGQEEKRYNTPAHPSCFLCLPKFCCIMHCPKNFDMAPKIHHVVFRVPKYVQAAILTSLGGVLFGLDTGTIGPITTMPQFAQTFGHLSSTIHGLVVSTILIPAAISSSVGGHLANLVGRPRAIAIGAGIFGIGAAIECASVRLAMLIAGRAIKGIGEGLFLSTVVVSVQCCNICVKSG